ncbi:hypothetical protein F4677DRAFT_447452 [Hypoxylon crocopeplum]|nr:hypothetical protein F4677DRAFT_447452 [Hypoxylon crocopeplum]
METTNLASSPKDRGRKRSLAVRPSTARATSGSARHHHTPHSPRSPLYTDTFTSAHPPIPPLPSSPPPPPAPSTSTAAVSAARPPSPSHNTAEAFQYALSSAKSVPVGLNFNAVSEQGWHRPEHDGAGDGGGDDEEDDPDDGFTPRQTMRR